MFGVIFFCFITATWGASSDKGYYWRDYRGTIPEDAVVGGSGRHKQPIYIVQAYLENGGLIPAKISCGDSQVEIEFNGVKVVDKYIKILCGAQNSFKWISTDSKRFYEDIYGKNPVWGGHEDGWGTYYVGKVQGSDGGDKVGKINQFINPFSNNTMYYVDDHKSKSSLSFDVLVID